MKYIPKFQRGGGATRKPIVGRVESGVIFSEKNPVIGVEYRKDTMSPSQFRDWYEKSSGRAEVTDSPIDWVLMGGIGGAAKATAKGAADYIKKRSAKELADILAKKATATTHWDEIEMVLNPLLRTAQYSAKPIINTSLVLKTIQKNKSTSKYQLGGTLLNALTDWQIGRSSPEAIKETRKKVYNTVRPSHYTDSHNYARFITGNKREEWDDARSEEAFKIYLDMNDKPKYFSQAVYKPSEAKDPKASYYKADTQLEQDIFNSFKDKLQPGESKHVSERDVKSKFGPETKTFKVGNQEFVQLVPSDKDAITGRPMISRARALGEFKVGRSSDDKGEYISYYDKYDFNTILQNTMQGKPYEIYGRVYYPKK